MLTDFEKIYFQIEHKNNVLHFISTYKSPSTYNTPALNLQFLLKLEDLLFQIDKNDPIFIIGDLNMDLFSNKGSELKQFMIVNDIKNFVTKFTRIATNYYSNKDVYRTSKTLIGVILHNKEEIISTKVFGCPFSDHSFVLATLSIY